MFDSANTSRCGQMHHLRRQDVLTYYLDAQLRETPATLEDFALTLAREYVARVPDHARSIDIDLPDERAMTPMEFGKALGRLRKRVQRWVSGDVTFPAEMEEAWSYALQPPYGERCRHELAWRYGFMGAMSPAADPCPDAEVMGRLLMHTGSATSAIAVALANHHFDFDDVADGRIEAELSELMSDVGSILARVRAVRSAGVAEAAVTADIAHKGLTRVR